MGDLTKNFSRAEFDRASSGGHFPDEAKLAPLAALAQWLRDLAGSPGLVTSAYRDAQHNQEVHGASSSQHTRAEAVDVYFPLASLRALGTAVLAAVDLGSAPDFGQVILYNDLGHVHVSLPTLGSRNGEVRYSYVANGERVYPLLSDPAQQLQRVSDAQARQGFRSPAGSSRSRSSAGSSSASVAQADGADSDASASA